MPYQYVGGFRAVKEFKDRSDENLDSFNPSMFAPPICDHITTYTFRVAWKYFYPNENVKSPIDWTNRAAGYAGAELLWVLDQAASVGRYVNLLITAGFDAPLWVKNSVPAGEKDNFEIPYGPGHGTCLPFCVPWSTTYTSAWYEFVGLVGAKVATHPALRFVAVSGPTAVSVETGLPDVDPDHCVVGNPRPAYQRWQELGYTSTKWLNCWHESINVFKAAFPHQYLSVALHRALPLGPSGDFNLSYRDSVRTQVIQQFEADVPSAGVVQRFVLQTSGLDGQPGFEPGFYEVAARTHGRPRNRWTHAGYQLQSAATKHPDKVGDPNDGVHAFYLAITKGMLSNPNFFEVYQPDWLSTAVGVTPPVVGMTVRDVVGMFKPLVH
jgi:hypothetical protein